MEIVAGNLIAVFRSKDENFWKERDGRKSNTVRCIPNEEWNEFKRWKESIGKQIRIKHVSNPLHSFDRVVTDVTLVLDCRSKATWIISWRPKE
jgi:hypothetical protein